MHKYDRKKTDKAWFPQMSPQLFREGNIIRPVIQDFSKSHLNTLSLVNTPFASIEFARARAMYACIAVEVNHM